MLRKSSEFPVEMMEVSAIDESVVRETAREIGGAHIRLTNRQVSLLQTVQNLAMWIEIVRSGSRSPDFESATALMREFWARCRREIEQRGISARDRDEVLERLVSHMEKRASLSAPVRLLGTNAGLNTELQTLGLVQVTGNTVTFGHQSYLDFLIADRVVQNLDDTERSIFEWLGHRTQQSLFRREQLRQVLFLVADEAPQLFVRAVRALLASPEVRFHLKQLVLEALGQIRPDEAILNLVIELLLDHRWRDHMLSAALWRNADLVRGVAARGVIHSWLDGSNEHDINTALWLLDSIADREREMVAELCAPLIDRGGGWPQRLQGIVLRSDPLTEPDCWFALRLRYMKASAAEDYVPWGKLADAHPDRALRLLSVALRHRLARNGEPSNRQTTLEMDGHEDVRALVRAAAIRPRLAWRLFGRMFKRQILRRLQLVRRIRRGIEPYSSSFHRSRTPPILIAIIRSVLQSLAARRPDEFFPLADGLSQIPSRVIQRILVQAYGRLPAVHADTAIIWLWEREFRLRCGTRRRFPAWESARRLIERMSPHCSDRVFLELESRLLMYRDPREKRSARSWLAGTRWGRFDNGFGAAQHFLLPGLSATRRSLETISRIGVLQRKFAGYPADYFLRPRSRGGWVRSPLDRRRLTRMSDRAWLALISNREIAQNPRKAFFTKSVVEVSVEMLSRDLRHAALCNPERFGKLAMRIPASAPADYVGSILDAVSHTKPLTDIPEPDRGMWTMASTETVEALLNRPGLDLADANLARQFCWVLAERDDVRLSPLLLDRLIGCATHADPLPETVRIHAGKSAAECSLNELEENTLSSVRALAARAISQILFSRPDLFPALRPAIGSLWDDPHPAVRIAAVEICYPLWNSDRRTAVDGFRRVVAADIRIAASATARRLYNHLFPEFGADLVPVIVRMLEHEDEAVVEAGAVQVAARFFFQALFADQFTQCLSGTVPQRKGIARVVAQLLVEEEHREACEPYFELFANDPDPTVRTEIARVLWNARFLSGPNAPRILTHFLRSQSFGDNPTDPIRVFQIHPVPVGRFSEPLLHMSDVLVLRSERKERQVEPHTAYAATELTPLLLQLYEESSGVEGESVRQRCLDAWDQLLEARLGPTESLTRAIDM